MPLNKESKPTRNMRHPVRTELTINDYQIS